MIKPKLRFGTDKDARDVREILEANNQIPAGHDWSELGPYWIIAEYDETVVGCCQILVGKPLGHMNFLAVLPGYHHSGVGAYLAMQAEKLLTEFGADGYTATTINEQILKKLPKLGGIVFGKPVNLVYKRVARKGK